MMQASGRIVIAGGRGFLGTALAESLTADGHEVVILSRHPYAKNTARQYVIWDARTTGRWVDYLEGASAIINLAGRSVDCIKTTQNQDEILRLRVEATRVLGAAVRLLSAPPPVWIQMSTAHIYGDPPTLFCDENSAFGYGFAPDIGKAWEEEFMQSFLPSQRPVIFRTSFVLGRNRGSGQGALSKLIRLARLGLGGTIGAGSQGISWIHELDLCQLFHRAIHNQNMQGAYIASAPNPVSQRLFAAEIRRAVRIPIGLPVSSWMVNLGARLFLKTDPDLALLGRYVVSKRLEEEVFNFQFPEIRGALRDLIVS